MSFASQYRRFVKALTSPFSTFWEGQRDRHFVILGSASFLGFCGLMWTLVFFFFLEGSTRPEWEEYVAWSWGGAIFGITLLFFAGPEFVHYHGQYSLLKESFQTTSRADLRRNQKEAQVAATELGSIWEARLQAHYIECGVIRARELPSEAKNKAPEDALINWANTDDSNLSRLIQSDVLRIPLLNIMIGIDGLVMVLLQLYNMGWGLARAVEGGPRVNTLHIWQLISGTEPGSYAAPYFDDISGWILLLLGAFLFWGSLPASGERPQPSEDAPAEEE